LEASSFNRPSPRRCGTNLPRARQFQVKDGALARSERRLIRDVERDFADRAALYFDVERRQRLTLERFGDDHPHH
jgi:hypothetical protein